MKKFFLLLLAAGSLTAARGQNIVLGERVPELRTASWNDTRRPAETLPTLVLFLHPSADGAAGTVEEAAGLADRYAGKLNVVLLARQKPAEAAALLAPYADSPLLAAFDDTGRTFDAFGILYVPFGVLTDRKGRALWMGNPARLTPRVIEQYIR